jgi:protein-L-isoaspartate(D-aspartate) O-methyltransferase
MQNYNQACTNMITQQLRTNQVVDVALLDLIRASKREDFVPKAYREFAYADLSIPLGDGQVMMTPTDEARMLNALQVKASDHVLEVGTGSGYITSLLAALSHHTLSLDIRPHFIEGAQAKLQTKGFHNIELQVSNIFDFKADEAFDAIAITGALNLDAKTLAHHVMPLLQPNARLFAILGQAPIMQAFLFTRTSAHEPVWQQTFLFETVVPSLDQVPSTTAFRF